MLAAVAFGSKDINIYAYIYICICIYIHIYAYICMYIVSSGHTQVLSTVAVGGGYMHVSSSSYGAHSAAGDR